MRLMATFLSAVFLCTGVWGCTKADSTGESTLATTGAKAAEASRESGEAKKFIDMDGASGAPEAKKAEKMSGGIIGAKGTKIVTGDDVVFSKKTDAKGPPASPTTAPAVADPVIGTATKTTAKPVKMNQNLRSGVLTAGSFDDNLDPLVFHSFVAKRGQHRMLGDLPRQMVGQRLLFSVRDSAGKPIGNARVKLSLGDGPGVEIATRSDGRAVFMLSFDELPGDQPLTAVVTPPEGAGPAVTEKVSPGADRWDVTLPSIQASPPRNLDLAIVLDTTGSMQDEIDHLKAEMRGISAAIQKKFPEVTQRFALVLYRDEGDEYVVRSFDFTTSLDAFHKNISAQRAGGGGDYPEAMHKGIEAANQLRWRDSDTANVMFLIADAPPHAQYVNATLKAANALRRKGVAIYPVACSGYDDACEFVMRSCALLTGSQFLFLTDDSGVGNGHAEPKIPYYSVERLEHLMVRMIAGELSGQRVEADPKDIIRKVGAKRGN